MTDRQAIDVEALLIWVYRDQQAHKVAAAHAGADYRLGFPSRAADGTVTVGRNMELGQAIAGSRQAFRLDDDALRVHDLVEGIEVADLLIRQAVLGEPPDRLEPSPPRYEPEDGWKRDRRSGTMIGRQSRTVERDGRFAYFTPIRLIDDSSHAAMLDRQFDLWHAGLCELARVFSFDPNLLKRFTVCGPARPPRVG